VKPVSNDLTKDSYGDVDPARGGFVYVWSRVGVITIASENVRANCSTVPKIAAMRSVYLAA